MTQLVGSESQTKESTCIKLHFVQQTVLSQCGNLDVLASQLASS